MNKRNQLHELNRLGQFAWVDFITRDYLRSGDFEKHLRWGVTGVTSNPTILLNAIQNSSLYDDVLSKSLDALEAYESIIKEDISVAATLLYPIYQKSEKQDGYVSIEVDPAFANRVEPTIHQGCHLYNLIDSSNVMIKVPGTDAGIMAFKQLIIEGINVNVTLLFSVEQYERVAWAYVEALEERLVLGRSIHEMASVASFFVSRIDTTIDTVIKHLLSDAGEKDSLMGLAAIANAKLAYCKCHEIFHSSRFIRLKKEGAIAQRLLWASTSVKNPAYDELKYVTNLLGSGTINTLPPTTLNAIYNYDGVLRPRLESYASYDAEGVMQKIQELGINFSTQCDWLLESGLKLFATSFDTMMNYLYQCTGGNQDASRNTKSRFGLV